MKFALHTVLAAVLVGAAAAHRRLWLSPPALARPGDPVSIWWCGSMLPDANLIASLVRPDDTRVLLGHLPLTRLHRAAVPESEGSEVAGKECATLTLALPYVRGLGIQFDLAANDTTFAITNVVRATHANHPWQIHLSLTNSHEEMRVMWTTQDKLLDSMVCWGVDANASEHCSMARVDSYGPRDLCGSPANDTETWLHPGHFNDAVMKSLQPGQRYYYRVGSLSGGMSDVLSFIAPPPVDASTPTELFVYGDMGTLLPLVTDEEQQPPSVQTAAHIARAVDALHDKGVAAAVVHIGDISYARGFVKFWDSFMQLIQPYASRAPYMVSLGNHEYDWPGQDWAPSWSGFGLDSGGECGVPTFQRFHMVDSPVDGNVSRTGRVLERNIAYSFDFGNVHVALFSSEHDYLPGSQQYAFLEQDLASVNRSRTPWVIVGGHRPMYSTSTGYSVAPDRVDGGQDDHLRGALEPMLLKNKVDVALWGHVHTYERTCGITGNFECGERDEDGMVHVVIGTAGNVCNGDWAPYLPESPHSENSIHHNQPEWNIFRTMNFGFARVFSNATHLRLRFIADHRGGSHDEFWLHKE